MKVATLPSLASLPSLPAKPSVLVTLFSMGFLLSLMTGCGSSNTPTPPKFSGNTQVTVMLTSTANDQLSEFDLPFQSITLTSQSGKTATLLSTSEQGVLGAEFLHLNGTAEPLVTASIPQDVYTAATVALTGALFTCIQLGPDNGQQVLDTSTYDDLGMSASDVNVTLPSPISVTGTSLALSLDLLVAKSASYSACFTPNGVSTFSITPTFALTPLMVSASPTNAANGKVTGLDGQISLIETTGNTFTLSLANIMGSRTVSVRSDANTAYQGVSDFSALAAGTFVDMDGGIQPDGSILATRIAVEDTSAGDMVRGPLMEVTPSVSVFDMHAREQQGKDFPPYVIGLGSFKYDSAAFQISGQLTNLGSLPFVPSFNGSNIVPGQELYISAASIPSGGYPTATTVTLLPQTIDGTVTATAATGNFTDYTVTLASYDLFPMLAVQPGQTTVENNPSRMEVYVDRNTQQLNTQALAVGSTLRFYGLVFNDNGTLRMDCAQVSDGVAFSSANASASRMKAEQVRIIRYDGPGGSLQMATTVTHSQ